MAKILIVDDDENLMRLLIAAFRAKGHEVQGISNGSEARSYLENDANALSLNLLILDRMLGDMDGVEILRFFRDKYGKKVPVLILSTLSSEKDVVEGLERGAGDYLSKPFSVDVLVRKAEKLIG